HLPRIIIFIISFWIVKNASAQSEYAFRELNQIQHLIETYHLDSAEEKLKHLEEFITQNEFSTNTHYLRLKTNLYYGKIFERNDEFQKSINRLITIIEDSRIQEYPELLY